MKIINVNGKDYALKLTIGSIKNLEKRLGENPLNYFSEFGGEKLPELTPLSVMFHACLTNMNHGITEEESDNILTDWVSLSPQTQQILQLLILQLSFAPSFPFSIYSINSLCKLFLFE